MTDNFYLKAHQEQNNELTKEMVDNLFTETKSPGWSWDTDMYVELAAKIHNIPTDRVTPKQRTHAKTLMYGNMYS